jgi:Arc/MetJ-type ribon-helix-helix transcriptional regulator
MLLHMKQILVQLDESILRMLDQVAPGRSRKRSKFIRQAIASALLEIADEKTRRAYERLPDDEREEAFDPADWAPESEAIHPPKPLRKRRPKRRRQR